VHGDRPANLTFLPIQVPENHLDLERVRIARAGLRKLVDRLVDLLVDEKVEAEHVVRRLAQTPPIDPATVTQLVSLPGFAGRHAHQQRDQYGKQDELGHCAFPTRTPNSQPPTPKRMSLRRFTGLFGSWELEVGISRVRSSPFSRDRAGAPRRERAVLR
jgi:hypothetical protein